MTDAETLKLIERKARSAALRLNKRRPNPNDAAWARAIVNEIVDLVHQQLENNERN